MFNLIYGLFRPGKMNILLGTLIFITNVKSTCHSDMIWTPDLELYNSASKPYMINMEEQKYLVMALYW